MTGHVAGWLRGARFLGLAALLAFAASGCVDVQAPSAEDEACDCDAGTCPSGTASCPECADQPDGCVCPEVDCPGEAPPNGNQSGVCEGSRQACVDGAWADDYRAVAGWETDEQTCDALDNDCDGETDEGFGEVTCGQGECLHKVAGCEDGAPEPCDPFLGATAETCSGRDDDCDGATDTDDPDLVAPAASPQQGVCAGAREVCADGEWQAPDWAARAGWAADEGATHCDGLDNDCDGTTDEGCECTTGAERPCGSGIGECEQGTQACVAGAWSAACAGEVPAAEGEDCDRQDDDCDGETDEAADLTAPLAARQDGVCAGAAQVCSDGEWVEPDYAVAIAAYEADEATCDALDNDCDGATDEGLCDDGDACNGVEICNGQTGGCVPGTPPDCDDDDPCTTDRCERETGCEYDPSGAAGCCDTADDCDDGNPCTTDTCAEPAGICANEFRSGSCDDGDACTTNDTCDAAQQACLGQTVVCDDSNACNGVETCDSGTGCVEGTAPVCDDGDACNGLEACDPEQGCLDGTPLDCDDEDACNGGETCDPSLGCVDGTPPTCDDANVCNGVETCNPATGCVPGTPLDCDDENACNGAETCDAVAGCQAGTPPDCDDENVCNGVETCAPATGCVAGTPLVCDDQDACNGVETCAPATGCVAGAAPECDDGSDCTLDRCDDERGCLHVPSNAPGCCLQDEDCDDDNLCTFDSCDQDTRACENAPLTGACDDGSACTTDDECVDGVCTGTPVVCDDSDPCNGVETCARATGCVPGTAPDCDDDDECTDDACVAPDGCVHTNNTDPCDDGDACTVDTACADGVCGGGSPLACDDGIACTVDDCAPAGGCTHTPDHGACAVAFTCVTGATCQAGVGCVYQENDGGCSDGDPCTGVETCDATCAGPDCNPVTGCRAGTALVCDDGNPCDGTETCLAFVGCEDGTPPDCDDDNDCTNDVCVTNLGCRNTNKTNGIGCSTGDPCRIGAQCTNGVCGGGTTDSCDDGAECTIDTCVAGVGCANTPSDQWCVDNYPYSCLASTTCNAGGTCVFTYDGGSAVAACSDGDPCDGEETCSPRTCAGEPDCDASGCLQPDPSVANGDACTDDDPCTAGDTCQDGVCVGGVETCDVCSAETTLSCSTSTAAATTRTDAQATDIIDIWAGACTPTSLAGTEVAYRVSMSGNGQLQTFFTGRAGELPAAGDRLIAVTGDTCVDSACASQQSANPLRLDRTSTDPSLIVVWDTATGSSNTTHIAHARCFTPGGTACPATLSVDRVFQCPPGAPPGLYGAAPLDYGATCSGGDAAAIGTSVAGPEKVWAFTIPGTGGVTRRVMAYITDEEGGVGYYNVFLIPTTAGCATAAFTTQSCAASSIRSVNGSPTPTGVATLDAAAGTQWCVVVDAPQGPPPSKLVLSLSVLDLP